MTTNTPSRFAPCAHHNGAELTLIGDWQDLAAYYLGPDGAVWCLSVATGRFSNCGDVAAFRECFARRYRGRLFE